MVTAILAGIAASGTLAVISGYYFAINEPVLGLVLGMCSLGFAALFVVVIASTRSYDAEIAEFRRIITARLDSRREQP